MDTSCTAASSDWGSNVFIGLVTVLCFIWAFRQVQMQISRVTDQRRAREEKDDYRRAIRHLVSRRDRSLTKAFETIRSGERQRLRADAECFAEAIRRLHAAETVGTERKRWSEA